MSNTFTAICERDGDWYGRLLSGSAGSQRSGAARRRKPASLAGAIDLIFQDRREA